MRRYRISCFVALAAFLAASSFGQATSSLRGKVIDSQGALIPGVALQLLNAQTSFTRSVLSDEAGAYQFSSVPPGVYDLVAEMPGFAVVTNTGVTLQVNSPATLDVRLEVASLSETVSVEAEAVRI